MRWEMDNNINKKKGILKRKLTNTCKKETAIFQGYIKSLEKNKLDIFEFINITDETTYDEVQDMIEKIGHLSDRRYVDDIREFLFDILLDKVEDEEMFSNALIKNSDRHGIDLYNHIDKIFINAGKMINDVQSYEWIKSRFLYLSQYEKYVDLYHAFNRHCLKNKFPYYIAENDSIYDLELIGNLSCNYGNMELINDVIQRMIVLYNQSDDDSFRYSVAEKLHNFQEYIPNNQKYILNDVYITETCSFEELVSLIKDKNIQVIQNDTLINKARDLLVESKVLPKDHDINTVINLLNLLLIDTSTN